MLQPKEIARLALSSLRDNSASFEAMKVKAKAFAAAYDQDELLAFSRAFGHRVVVAWWSSLGCTDPLRPPLEPFVTVHLSRAVMSIADSIGYAAAQLDAETAAYEIGKIYTGILPREMRSALGIYYTPPALTKRLIDQATKTGVDWATARVLDPACGGGAFLAPVAARIVSALPNCSPRILVENIGNRLRGFEIDPFGAWLSQVTLDAVLLDVTSRTGTRLPVVVTVCDSLRCPHPTEPFDLVIGNPPYGRVRLDADERAQYKRCLFGHANLYGLFTDVALRHAKTDGIVAYVTPTSFLAGEYFKNLRALLAREAPPVSIDFVTSRQDVFEDVLQETMLATYRRRTRRRTVQVHEIAPTETTKLLTSNVGKVTLPSDRSQPWILPRSAHQTPLVKRLAHMSNRLTDWGYSVSTGPLVWNRFKEQLVDEPGPSRLPLIWAEAVTADGRFVYRADKKNHKLYFEVCEGNNWLVVSSPCVLVQRTTAKEQHRRLIAAALPVSFLRRHKAVVIENHLNMVRPIVDNPAVSPDLLVAFLNSGAADHSFRCISGSVAVSAYELESLPLPAPEELAPLRRLIAAGSDRAVVEAECSRLYSAIG